MVHEKYVSLDSHNDTAGWLNHPDGDFGVTKGQVTFPLMKEGGLDAAFFAIYLDQGPLNDFSRDSVYNYAMNEIALFKKYIAEHSDEAEIGYAPEDLKKIKKKGKRCVVFALENGYGIGKDLDKINKFYDEGVRYITLCHNYVNDICDASRYTKGHSWGGLSEFGYKVVERMNELGMIIDFSHASSSTLWDLLECSKAPVIATHSSVWELKKNNRNLPAATDDEIKAIAKAGGLIQLASGRFFLSDLPKKEVTIKHLADHIDYVKNLVGAEYIGLGTDFDGGGGYLALNEATIHRHGATMMSLYTSVNGNRVSTYHGDGLVVSTPTGSTAYSLSAGGPVVDPMCRCFILSPLAPHNLTMRPVVVPDSVAIELQLVSRGSDAFISLDNRTFRLRDGAKIRICLAEEQLILATSHNNTFYDTLRNKMMWGVDPR